jgi:hypothetical protein
MVIALGKLKLIVKEVDLRRGYLSPDLHVLSEPIGEALLLLLEGHAEVAGGPEVVIGALPLIGRLLQLNLEAGHVLGEFAYLQGSHLYLSLITSRSRYRAL